MCKIDTAQYEAYENNDKYGFWWSYLHRLPVIQIIVYWCGRVCCNIIVSLEFGHCVCVCVSVNCVRFEQTRESEKEVGEKTYKNNLKQSPSLSTDFMISHLLFSFEVSYREKKGRLKSVLCPCVRSPRNQNVKQWNKSPHTCE